MKDLATNSFYEKENFDLTKLKRDDIVITYDNHSYLYTKDDIIINLSSLDVNKLSSIALEIRKIKRSGNVIALRKRYYQELKRSRQYDRNSKNKQHKATH